MIHQAVDALVRRYQTSNPFVLSRYLQIVLMPRKTPNGLWGIYVWHDAHAYFGYDEGSPLPKQHEFVAHGIGHCVLHRDTKPLILEWHVPQDCPLEQDAQRFAERLLKSGSVHALPEIPSQSV